MSSKIKELFISLKQLRQLLADAKDKAVDTSGQAAEIGGEFEQEISTDIDSVHDSISAILDELDSMIEEANTLWDDSDEMEESLRKGLDDEENYKTDAEHIQDEMREDKE